MDSTTEQVGLVRDFNRYYTRRLGVLTERYLDQDRPLSEARLLFEIGDRADVRDLRTRLGLDSGYLSRLLRSLAEQNLARVRPHPDDGRVRIVELTDAGIRERTELDRRSSASVNELLTRLTPGQRTQLITAQTQIRRLLRSAAVLIETVDAASAPARQCLRAYADELTVRFPEGYDSGALVDPDELTGDNGALLLAREEDHPVGCGAWRALGPGVAEVRHLWVSAEARGLGIGRRLLRALETAAAAHGATVLRLGTHTTLTEAITLYRASGYREIPPYDDSRYHHLHFEKTLA
ncbi:MarR family transcriptional regulator with acetyltransferase activity [Micromonospora pisi]|uniref:MarR family transcriptional regulator with acetyltransferase activity n=1 Tax=Micromonospora pisi TaxID=589240 RepID=A0A495JY95_9ACTN|nr:helix-turn-helix domain-containing GNAT family N-acetyltransferase [Micromonospora pisi]RKR93169.1 MarR family transcriptional regulator with acetyltransferase activity [Micromonospora pisi]